MGVFQEGVDRRQSIVVHVLGLAVAVLFAALPVRVDAAVANEYVDELMQNVQVFCKEYGINEFNFTSGKTTYLCGDLGTMRRTGDIALDYDINTGALKVFGSIGFDNFYIKSSGGKMLSFTESSFYVKADLILALEPIIALQDFYAEKLVAKCGQHGITYEVEMPASISRGISAIFWTASGIGTDVMFQSYEVASQEAVEEFLEKLLNGAFCPLQYSIRDLAILSMLSGASFADAIPSPPHVRDFAKWETEQFVRAICGNFHGNDNYGSKCNSDINGFIVGVGRFCKLPLERYFRIGIASGCANAKTQFPGLSFDVKHDIHAVEMFSAYGMRRPEDLQTEAKFVIAYNRGTDKVSYGISTTKEAEEILCENRFFRAEIVHNLSRFNGCQFGPWLLLDCGHMRQSKKRKDFSFGSAASVRHNIFMKVIGISIEKENDMLENTDTDSEVCLRCGWAHFTIGSDDKLGSDTIFHGGEGISCLQESLRDSAIISLEIMHKYNSRWNLTVTCDAKFNKNFLAGNLHVGLARSF
ncbi:MAG: hypothetical protein LBC42_00190 [Puniceicoccales bacterium]|nr:hypothetical protein [Puniceicoccales bacterium]